jgi:hypothetical protein
MNAKQYDDVVAWKMDGKKMDTLGFENFAPNSWHKTITKIEHVVVVNGQTNEYIGEFSPEPSTGAAISIGLIAKMRYIGIG